MSGTKSSDSDNPSRGSTVEDASKAIEGILSQEAGDTGKPKKQDEGDDEDDVVVQPEDETPEPEDGDEPTEDDDAEGEDDADDDGGEPDEPAAKAKAITVEIDGKAVTLTADEVRAGYLRGSDYTRKTMALSEERKLLHAHAAAVQTERQQYAALLPALQQQLQEAMPQEPEWNRLAIEDPVEFNRLWAVKQIRDQKLQAIQAEQRRLYGLQQQETEQVSAQQIAVEKERMVAANPRWADAERWKQDRTQVRNYLTGYGYTDAEIGAVTDHRAVVIAHKARLWDEAVAKGQQARGTPRVAQAGVPVPARPSQPQTQRPGSAPSRRPPSELTRAKQRLAKTHSVSDAASVIARLL
jgi:hypothetical protein